MSAPVKKAVFPVAGLGTRFLPATKAVPKEMLTVVDKPVIQYAVDEARRAGIEEFVFVTSRGKQALEDHLDKNIELYDTLRRRGKDALLAAAQDAELPAGKFSFVRQAEPLGLGHAIWCARQVIGDEPFAVLLPDEVFLTKGAGVLSHLVACHGRVGGNLIAVREVPQSMTDRYGIVEPANGVGGAGEPIKLKGLVEKPRPYEAPSTLSIVGRYILQPEVFRYLERFETGAGNEIQLTDAMAKLMLGADGGPGQDFHGVPFEGERFDCGTKEGFVTANIAFALVHPDMGEALVKSLPELSDRLGLPHINLNGTGR